MEYHTSCMTLFGDQEMLDAVEVAIQRWPVHVLVEIVHTYFSYLATTQWKCKNLFDAGS